MSAPKVKFYLNRKSDKETTLMGVIHANGMRYKYATRVTVPVKHWNSRTSRVRENAMAQDAALINSKISLWETLLADVFAQVNHMPSVPSQADFKAAVDKVIKQPGLTEVQRQSLTNYAQGWIESVSRSINTIKRHKTVLGMLLDYEKRNGTIIFDRVNIALYNSLKKYYETQGYSLNTIGDVIKSVKMWMRSAADDGLHNTTGYLKFKVPGEEADTIYLNIEELKSLHDLVIDYDMILDNFPDILKVKGNINKAMQRLIDAKDRFLVGAFTALRYQDYSTLVVPAADSKFISARSLKTGARTTIPMHYIIKDIIERRGGTLPPAVSNQKMNQALKVLGKAAGINSPVEVTITKGGRRVSKVVPKYMLITTHTARRSGCTNMYLEGIPIKVIMAFSGHKTIKSFLKYIKVGQFEDAIRMQDHPYFTG